MKLSKLCVEQKMTARNIVEFFKSYNISYKLLPSTEIPDTHVRLLRRYNKQIQVSETLENKRVKPDRTNEKNKPTGDQLKKPAEVSNNKDISKILPEQADSESDNHILVFTSTSPKANVTQSIKPQIKKSNSKRIRKKRMLKFKAKLDKKKAKRKGKSSSSRKGGGVSKIYGSIFKLTPIFKKR